MAVHSVGAEMAAAAMVAAAAVATVAAATVAAAMAEGRAQELWVPAEVAGLALGSVAEKWAGVEK